MLYRGLHDVLRRGSGFACLLLAALFAGGCASSGTAPGDPLQRFNKPSHAAGERLDKVVLKPVARAWNTVLPEPLRLGVRNFFNNIGGIDSALNGFLQGKPQRGFTDLGRVLVNSTLGLGGLFDPATRMGLAFQDEDFGQTLAVWGYRNSAYLYLPVVGPLTVRDLPTIALRFAWPRLVLGEHYNAATGAVDVLSLRADALALSDARDASALDPYVFTREAWLQRRAFQISDGEPSLLDGFEDFEDEFEDEPDESAAGELQ